jgi:hypothetical protein
MAANLCRAHGEDESHLVDVEGTQEVLVSVRIAALVVSGDERRRMDWERILRSARLLEVPRVDRSGTVDKGKLVRFFERQDKQ